MSAITRGFVAALLLAGAVAGVVAYPRILAGSGSAQTPSFVVPSLSSQPAIVRAQPLPVKPAFRAAAAPIVLAPVVLSRPLVVAPKLKQIVIQRVAPPARIAPKPARAPTQAPASTKPQVPVTTTTSAPPATPPAQARVPAVVTTPTPPASPATSVSVKDNGKGRDHSHGHGKNDRIEATTTTTQPTVTAPLGSGDGPSAQQAPPGTDSGDGGAVGHLAAPQPQAAPSDNGHGPPPWAHGHDKGH